MKSAIIVFPGSNREKDAEAALTEISGTPPVLVWHRDTELPKVDLVLVPAAFPTVTICAAAPSPRIRRSCAK